MTPSQLPRTYRTYGTASQRIELAFTAFPQTNKPATPTTAEALAACLARHAADAAGHAIPNFTVEHILAGEPPHQGHALRFNYANGTSDYFPPHRN